MKFRCIGQNFRLLSTILRRPEGTTGPRGISINSKIKLTTHQKMSRSTRFRTTASPGKFSPSSSSPADEELPTSAAGVYVGSRNTPAISSGFVRENVVVARVGYPVEPSSDYTITVQHRDPVHPLLKAGQTSCPGRIFLACRRRGAKWWSGRRQPLRWVAGSCLNCPLGQKTTDALGA